MASHDEGAVIDRLYQALAAGDLAGAEACITRDATVWHCFDGKAQGREEVLAGWRQLCAGFVARGVAEVRREPIAGGFVQRHVFHARTAEGRDLAWAVCLFVRLEDGLIARIDEYIDRAGILAWAGPSEPGPAEPGPAQPAPA